MRDSLNCGGETEARGFVGGHLCEHLIAMDDIVVGVDVLRNLASDRAHGGIGLT